MQNDDLIFVDTVALERGELPSFAYEAHQVREIDRVLIEDQGIPGLTLMKRAASAAVSLIGTRWPEAKSIRVYCGSGNNAADGYIVAGLLAQQQLNVEVLQIGDVTKLSVDGQSALNFCDQSSAVMTTQIDRSFVPDVVVDALLGTGFRGELRGEYALAIDSINDSQFPVLALDVPSGIALDAFSSGQAARAVRAEATVTFIGLKQGLLTGAAIDNIGDLYFAPLVDSSKAMGGLLTELLELSTLRACLPERPKDAHKFRFGHVLVVGGAEGMGGAPLMTALAAMRAGAGLVTLATHPSHANQLVGLHPEIMIRGVENSKQLATLIEGASLIAIGPGLSTESWGKEMFDEVVSSNLPLVVDADGLNILAHRNIKRDNWILTPHPGEAKRLLGRAYDDRFAAVEQLQADYGGVAILKGAGTLIANAQGISLCLYGNPGMSTAGMGDVLCGVIAGVLAQSQDLDLSAKLGVVLHSAAADSLVGQFGVRGLFATDLIPEVRSLINNV